MPKNTTGGNKAKKGRKYVPKKETTFLSDIKDPEERSLMRYAKVLKKYGDLRFDILCDDGKNRIGVARGKFRKRNWINIGDIVLVSLRPDITNDLKVDIIIVYKDDNEKRELQNRGFLKNLETEKEAKENIEGDFMFGDVDSEDKNKDKDKDKNSEDSRQKNNDDDDDDDDDDESYDNDDDGNDGSYESVYDPYTDRNILIKSSKHADNSSDLDSEENLNIDIDDI